jgi:hypothetical protein
MTLANDTGRIQTSAGVGEASSRTRTTALSGWPLPTVDSGRGRAWLDDPGQRAACSTTAVRRCDSCPTCPESLNSAGCSHMACSLLLVLLAPIDPNGTTTASHVSEAQSVIDVLVAQWLQRPPLSR